MKCKLLLLCFVLIFNIANGQAKKHAIRYRANVRDSSLATFIIGIEGAYQFPMADLRKRYGNSRSIGGIVLHKSKKNIHVGIAANYFFGNIVKEDSLFSRIASSDGLIINSDGQSADTRLYERGWFAGFCLGKSLPILAANKNCGLTIMAKAGYYQHKIKILGENVPQLAGDYKLGYDRLSAGLALAQSISFLHLSNNRRVNYMLSIEMMEGFSKGKRIINFDTGLPGTAKRFDLQLALKAAWLLPIYRRNKNLEYSF
jgi:hypothetical protein